MKALLNRFKEPSSWAAIATGLTGLGLNIPGGVIQAATYVLAGISGLLAFFLKEKPV